MQAQALSIQMPTSAQEAQITADVSASGTGQGPRMGQAFTGH